MGTNHRHPTTELDLRCRSCSREETLERSETGSVMRLHLQVEKRWCPIISVNRIDSVGDLFVRLFAENARHQSSRGRLPNAVVGTCRFSRIHGEHFLIKQDLRCTDLVCPGLCAEHNSKLAFPQRNELRRPVRDLPASERC